MSRETQVIVFASQKGGSGKTTVSAHVAVQAELAGAGPVAIIDTDPQGSMAKWWNARSSEAPAFAQVSVHNLATDIRTLQDNGYRLIIIDTPPAVTSTIAEVITHADLVVLPTRPSPHDLRAVGPTVDIVQHQRKPLVFVVNSATARARITGDTAVALSQHGTVAPVTLHHRVDFAASMIDGRTVGEVNPTCRSAKEVAGLWAYLEDRLARLHSTGEPHMEQPTITVEDAIMPPAPTVRHEDQPEEVMAATPQFAMPDLDTFPDFPAAPISTVVSREPQGATHEQTDSGGWDGIERRTVDLGPAEGMVDRRRARTFGRRHIA